MRFRPRRVIDLCIALIFFMVIYYFFIGFSSKAKPEVKQPPFLNKMRNDIYKIQDALGRANFADANIDKSMNYDNSGVVRQVQPPGSFLDEYTNLENEWGGPVMQTFTPDKLGNYEPTSIETRVGAGERGAPYHTNMADRQRADESLRAYGFNQFASDQISLNRSIPDTRPPDCKRWQYNEHGLTASVVVVFHNEGWSTLLRTALSAINRSPPHMLKEVVLVDDFSDKSHTKGPLDQFVQNKFPDGRIKVFRNPERMGLIQSRTRGAQFASGDVF